MKRLLFLICAALVLIGSAACAEKGLICIGLNSDLEVITEPVYK